MPQVLPQKIAAKDIPDGAWVQMSGRTNRPVSAKVEIVDAATGNAALLEERRKVMAHFIDFLPKYFQLKIKDRGLGAGVAMEAISIALEDLSEMAHTLSSMEHSLVDNNLSVFGISLSKFDAAHQEMQKLEADFVF